MHINSYLKQSKRIVKMDASSGSGDDKVKIVRASFAAYALLV